MFSFYLLCCVCVCMCAVRQSKLGPLCGLFNIMIPYKIYLLLWFQVFSTKEIKSSRTSCSSWDLLLISESQSFACFSLPSLTNPFRETFADSINCRLFYDLFQVLSKRLNISLILSAASRLLTLNITFKFAT